VLTKHSLITAFCTLCKFTSERVREFTEKMAGGAFVGPSTGGNYEGRVTTFVITTCLVAAMGGLIFGYDIGISGNKWKTF